MLYRLSMIIFIALLSLAWFSNASSNRARADEGEKREPSAEKKDESKGTAVKWEPSSEITVDVFTPPEGDVGLARVHDKKHRVVCYSVGGGKENALACIKTSD